MANMFFFNLASAGIASIGERQLFISDFVDIVIIAFFIYALIFLFKQTGSFSALIGVSSIIPIYILAINFNLTLTAFVIRSFLGVFFVALIVIFQEEFRRFFEYLVAFGTRRIMNNRSTAAPSGMIAAVTKAVFELADRRYGAIIVFPGQESVERHLRGGKVIDALVSEELLLSLFDPGSPGHDGAIVVTDKRIGRFGAHLPLTKNMRALGGRGTRHAAALGLSEKTDALVIVVSEETGNVSLARTGALIPLESPEKLEDRLVRTLGRATSRSSSISYNIFEDLIKKNSREKIIALLVSTALWFLIVFLSR